MQKEKILITGGTGFLGKAVAVKLKEKNPRIIGSKDADLRDAKEAERVTQGVDIVIHLAADCGGIEYNKDNPASLFYNNAMMALNIMEACRINAVKKIILVGSICGYPKSISIPFREENFWDGYPEETNAPYGLAKRVALVLAQSYRKQYGMNIIYLVLANIYGEHDHFDGEKPHVIPAMIKRFVEAKENGEKKVVLWGTGIPTREFLYVEDAAEAIVLAMKLYNESLPINIGTRIEITIAELAEKIKVLVGYEGRICWNASKSDGQMRRCLDVSRAKEHLNFKARTSLNTGLSKTLFWYLEER